jgi:hypothetical protein
MESLPTTAREAAGFAARVAATLPVRPQAAPQSPPRDDSRDEHGRPCQLARALDGEGNFAVRPSPIHGHGCFARRAFRGGELVGHAAVVRHASQYGGPGSPAVDRTALGRYVNHADAPNTVLVEVAPGHLHLATAHDVAHNEELTCHYGHALTEQVKAYKRLNTAESAHE